MAILLGVFMCLHTANAMEAPLVEEKENKRSNVTVRIWQPTAKIPNGHVSIKMDHSIEKEDSIEPKKVYASLWAENYYTDSDFAKQYPHPCAYPPALDKLAIKDPDETHSLSLNTKPMIDIWKKLKMYSLHDGPFLPDYTIYILQKVRWHEGGAITEEKSYLQLLYLNDRSLVKGLLYAGGINNLSQKLKHFSAFVSVLPNMSSAFEDIILNNSQIKEATVSLDEITIMVKEAIKYQKLLALEEKIREMKMDAYLNLHHYKDIFDRFEKAQNDSEISTRLQELQSLHQSDQSYFSPTGWYHHFSKEWKR